MKTYAARDVARLGLLGSIALVLFVLEALAPRPLPWMKLGLGNIGVLLALLMYGFAAALCVSTLKLVVGGLISGGLGGPAFLVSGGAGLASLAVMAAVKRAGPTLFSPVGLSTVGALIHQVMQLILAYLLFIDHASLFAFLPLALINGLISGILIGLLVYWSLEKIRANGWLAMRR